MPDANHPDLTALLARVVKLEEELGRTKAELALAVIEIKRKDRIIEGLRQRIFGSSSEKMDPAQLQLMFDELVLGKPAPSPDQSDGETSAPEGEKPSVAKTRRTKADRFPKNLKIIIEAVLTPDDVTANPDEWEQIGEKYHDELDVIKAEVLQATELQVDETPIEYLKPGHGSTKLGYLWIYNDPLGKACYYDWHTGRGHDCLLDFLGYDEETGTIGYAGDIQCDGYSAYSALAARFTSIRLAGCLAHIRRKFVEAMGLSPDITLPILLLIQRIYFIEKQTRWSKAPPACRELIRRARSRPIADELQRLIVAARMSQRPHDSLGDALTYAINQWDKFIVCLENGRLKIDNNLAENKVRPTKLGARNWMFFGNAEAGVNNALFYTLMANCKIHGLDPETYLTEVLKRLPHNATPEQAAELTPARFAAARRSEQQEVA